jgi:hypothetical protein
MRPFLNGDVLISTANRFGEHAGVSAIGTIQMAIIVVWPIYGRA